MNTADLAAIAAYDLEDVHLSAAGVFDADGSFQPDENRFWSRDIQTSIVPEPGTASMVWIGLLGLAVVGSPRERRERWLNQTRRSIRRTR